MRTILLVVLMTLSVCGTSALAEEIAANDTEEKSKEALRPASGEVFMNIGEVVVKDRKDATKDKTVNDESETL